jgi:hypothetical protein
MVGCGLKARTALYAIMTLLILPALTTHLHSISSSPEQPSGRRVQLSLSFTNVMAIARLGISDWAFVRGFSDPCPSQKGLAAEST